MIRLTRVTDYGIVLLAHVASEDPDGVHAARQLAEATHLPLPMVGKVLKTLVRRGLLSSHRGVRGGYSLAVSPEDVTLADIIIALEGPIAMTDCLEGTSADCEHEAHCPAQHHWQVINEVVTGALRRVTLAEMARPQQLTPRLVQVDVGGAESDEAVG